MHGSYKIFDGSVVFDGQVEFYLFSSKADIDAYVLKEQHLWD